MPPPAVRPAISRVSKILHAIVSPDSSLQYRPANRRRPRLASADSPSTSPPTSSLASGEEDDWLNRRRSSSSVYISNIVGLGLPVACVTWSPVLLLLWIGGGRDGRGGSGDGFGETEAISSSGDSWRIKVSLAGSGVSLFWSPARISFYLCCCGSSVRRRCGCGEARSSIDMAFSNIVAGFPVPADGGGGIRFFLPTCEIGLVLVPTLSGGFFPNRGVLLAGVLGTLMLVASDFLQTGDAMAFGHLVRPIRSTGKMYASDAGVLLLVPWKTFQSASSGGWPASARQLRPPVTRTTGDRLQGPECNFLFSQGCLCNWDVNYQKY